MISTVSKRVGRSILVVLLVTIAVVALLSFAPGSVAQVILGENATPEAVAKMNSELGLDQPSGFGTSTGSATLSVVTSELRRSPGNL